MNIKEYISTGIVESYVFGLVNDQEKEEFERMCAAHAEVKEARDSFEWKLEQQSLANAVAPPPNLRSRIFSELEIEKDKLNRSSNLASRTLADQEMPEKTPVIIMGGRMRYVAAASVILLVASTILNFYFFNQYKSFSAKYDGLVAQNAELAHSEKALQTSNEEYQSAFDKLRDPSMSIIKMAGDAVPSSPDPASMATVYWNTRTKDVFLFVNNMPIPASDKQYQLWAIVNGVPVDAGVFDLQKGVPIVTMKNIPTAQAFAITLEKKGGSTTPLGQMYVLGKVS